MSRKASGSNPAPALGGGCTAAGAALGTMGQAAIPTATLASPSQAPGGPVPGTHTALPRTADAARPPHGERGRPRGGARPRVDGARR